MVAYWTQALTILVQGRNLFLPPSILSFIPQAYIDHPHCAPNALSFKGIYYLLFIVRNDFPCHHLLPVSIRKYYIYMCKEIFKSINYIT